MPVNNIKYFERAVELSTEAVTDAENRLEAVKAIHTRNLTAYEQQRQDPPVADSFESKAKQILAAHALGLARPRLGLAPTANDLGRLFVYQGMSTILAERAIYNQLVDHRTVRSLLDAAEQFAAYADRLIARGVNLIVNRDHVAGLIGVIFDLDSHEAYKDADAILALATAA